MPSELKDTLNLPKTDFAMKANLPQNEPKRLEFWQKIGIYQRIREERKGAPKYLLHDGPPYANGEIHLGHALNKSLKDFVVKSKTMAGFDAPYVPGWDCHGLPIEIKVDEKLGRKKLEMAPAQVRRVCREYAQKYLNLQSEQFRRIGVFGDFEHPYSTMSPEYESVIARVFFDFWENGFVYKGLRPVYWCIFDRTALAEAEVEYEQHTSPSVWVKYALTSPAEKIDPVLAGKQVNTIIWTTTPWTLPASMAVAFHPSYEYVAVEDPHSREVFIIAEGLLEAIGLPFKLVPAPGTSQDVAMLLAAEKGARLIVSVGSQFNLVEFLDRNREGMSSTFLTRLRIGEILVDAKGVSRLYRPRPGLTPLLVVIAAGLVALIAVVWTTPALRDVADLLWLKLQLLLGA